MIKKILTLCTIAPAMLLANNIEITLERNTSNPNPLDIIVKVTNTSDEDTMIDTSNYPDKDGVILGANTFEVLEDGEKIPYIGPTVFPNSHPLKLKAGETYTTHANLKEFYRFTQGVHSYEIHYRDTDESNTLEMEANVTPIPHRHAKVTRSRGCSNNVMAILRGDQTRAQSYAQNVVNTLPTVDRNHALYRKWFGYADPGRYNAVYVNYQKIYQGFNQNVTYTCFPSSYRYCSGAYQNTMAFVYKDQPFNINICPNYLQYNESGKAMALVHEMSHFNATVGAVDGNGVNGNPYASNNGAQTLANIRPDLAIRNAYSYGYYAQELPNSNPGEGGGGSSNINYEFNNNQNSQGWSYRNMIQQYGGPHQGAWFFACNSSDPQLLSPNLNFSANHITKVQITIANNNPSEYSLLQVFWKTNYEPYFSEYKSKYIRISDHGGWSTYNINMQHPRWRGMIKQIRIDPVTRGNGSWIGIDSIRFGH